MKRFLRLLAVAVAVAGMAFVGGASAVVGGSGGTTDGTTASAGVDTGSAIVELAGDPLSTYVKTRPAPGKKVDFDSAAVKSYRAQLAAERNDFKRWLQQNAPAAQVVGQYDIALNAVAVRLNGTSLDLIKTAPQVDTAEYEALYTPADANDPDLRLVNALSAWTAAGGSSNAGKGVLVGVIDTGIDQTHPCFNPVGFSYPAGFPKGDRTYTTPKVVVARVFNNRTPRNGYTAEAVQEHGTHVAGTIACDLDTPLNGIPGAPYAMSGVAPAAQLGSYVVFPGDVASARSEDIFDAMEAAYQDGMDVVNMSLGGGSNGAQTLEQAAVNHLDAAGMVIAIAAGNSGPGHYTVQDPGAAQAALTAGAATVGHFLATPITIDGTTYGASSGSSFAQLAADLTAPLVVEKAGTALDKGCGSFPTDATGKIAVVSRGSCTFATKDANAAAAHASALIIVNNTGGDPIAMAGTGSVPAFMLPIDNAAAVKAADGHPATIGTAKSYYYSGKNDIMAGFSSQGPTDVTYGVKPDVVAPGVNVLSSIPSAYCAVSPCFAFFQGTSMATPHLAGTAAVVISQHRGWGADGVRSAIVNTATQDVLKKSTGLSSATDPNLIGAGREDVLSALNAQVGLNPVSVSFGAVPVNDGQPRQASVTITDLGGHGGTYTLAIDRQSATPGVTFAAPFSVSVPANGSTTFTVTMSQDPGVAVGDHWATLEVGSVAHEVLYTYIKP